MRSKEGRTGIPRLASAGAATLIILGLVLVLTKPNVLAQESQSSSTTTPAGLEGVPAACPVTVPGENAFTPTSEAPDGPPSVHDSVWYGTPELWTMINPDGEVWRGLPVGTDGNLTQKWLWWSDRLSSGDPEGIAITADHLDGTAPSVEVTGSGGASSSPSSPSLGTFMVTGFELPDPGCWKITGQFGDASVSFVVWVADHLQESLNAG